MSVPSMLWETCNHTKCSTGSRFEYILSFS